MTLVNVNPTILEGVESLNIYESGFGEVMTLFSDESTILEEISIDFDENKVATYDDYEIDNSVCNNTESGFGRVSTLDPTYLDNVQSYEVF